MSFFISTDGEENSSGKYNKKQIKEMVQRQIEEEKWDFVFAGANIDAFNAGQSYGFMMQNVAQIKNNKKSQKAIYRAVAQRHQMPPDLYRSCNMQK